jgi:cytochrome c-type biogenesis protein CcmH/NrfG
MSNQNALASLLTACLLAVGVLGDASMANAASSRESFLSRLRPSRWGFGQNLRGPAGTLLAAAAVFLLVAGIGAAVSYLGHAPGATSSKGTTPSSHARSGADGDLSRLKDYTRSIETKEPASAAAAGDLLPDVNTMIDRLAARLEAAPADIKGWRMLGWSYVNTGRYEEAATAYARALDLDPTSAEIKRAYDEAKAKASAGGNLQTASSSQTEADGKSEATRPHEGDTAIRAMVDGLARRLERSPRDVEGWTSLMRSRVVLGEREVAATAYRKALEVFNDDSDASGKLTAAASELGLKAE